MCIDQDDNELEVLEMIHHFVEILDRYFGSVCELDLIFNFHKAYYILDEILIAGELQESSKKTVARLIAAQDSLVENAKEEASSFSNIIAQATKWGEQMLPFPAHIESRIVDVPFYCYSCISWCCLSHIMFVYSWTVLLVVVTLSPEGYFYFVCCFEIEIE